MAINKNKQAVIVELKRQWRSGTKWCAFKNVECICIKEIKCFRTYSQAAIFCEEKNSRFAALSYKVVVITDLLKRLFHSVKSKRQMQTVISKAILCEKYPPLSFPISIDHLAVLPADRYFPVVWNKVINPLTDISEWLVTLKSRPNTIMFRIKEYSAVLTYFMKQTGTISKAAIRDELKLQAKLRAASVSRYLDLYRFYYHTRRASYMLDKKIDETNPFLLPVVYFAKYNQRLKRLEFFDESLKKIAAGKIVAEVDVQYYEPLF